MGDERRPFPAYPEVPIPKMRARDLSTVEEAGYATGPMRTYVRVGSEASASTSAGTSGRNEASSFETASSTTTEIGSVYKFC
jgi:hypothetical protein